MSSLSSFVPQVQSALEGMLRAECPAEVLSMESFTVKYHRDYEDEHTGVGGEHMRSLRIMTRTGWITFCCPIIADYRL